MVIIHADSEVFDCDLLTAIELLPQSNNLNAFIGFLEGFKGRVDLLMGGCVPWSAYFFLLAPILLLRGILRNLLGKAAKEWMLFSSPFIGDDLVEVPSEDKVKEDVEDEAEEGIPDDVIVELSTEGRGELVGLGIDQRVKCDD